MTVTEQLSALDSILVHGDLHCLFQPILSLSERRLVGYEALTRGPSNSPLHSPLALFAVARQCGRLSELELLCRQCAFRRFRDIQGDAMLFLNVSPESLLEAGHPPGRTLQLLQELGISPNRVVIELTEQTPIDDFDLLDTALHHYRAMGFSIALDDLGAGYSSLRLWSELRPDYVKIDRHFVDGIHLDPVKREFVGSILKMARASRAQVIAEGIELAEELAVLSEMGVDLVQGYLFGRPQEHPATDVQQMLPGATGSPPSSRRPARRPAHAATATARGRHAHVDPGRGGNLPPPSQSEFPGDCRRRTSTVRNRPPPRTHRRAAPAIRLRPVPAQADQPPDERRLPGRGTRPDPAAGQPLADQPRTPAYRGRLHHHPRRALCGDGPGDRRAQADHRGKDPAGPARQSAHPAARQRTDPAMPRTPAAAKARSGYLLRRHRQFQALQRSLRLRPWRRGPAVPGAVPERTDRSRLRVRRSHRRRRLHAGARSRGLAHADQPAAGNLPGPMPALLQPRTPGSRLFHRAQPPGPARGVPAAVIVRRRGASAGRGLPGHGCRAPGDSGLRGQTPGQGGARLQPAPDRGRLSRSPD
nr:hypothetical protein OBG92_01688 [Pseudomonas aeruginosa]